VSNNLPTIEQAIDDRDCSLIFWRTSTDVIIAPESPYAYESQGRHIRLDAFPTSSRFVFCPRCYNDWDWAVVHGGLARCKTRECHTAIESYGWKPSSVTEEEIVFDEFEDDLHDEIANDIEGGTTHDKFLSLLNADPLAQYYNISESMVTSRAKDNIDNPPTIGEDMNGAREEFDTGERYDSNEFDTTTSPQGNNNKEEQ
jgi:hypothetical protein